MTRLFSSACFFCSIFFFCTDSSVKQDCSLPPASSVHSSVQSFPSVQLEPDSSVQQDYSLPPASSVQFLPSVQQEPDSSVQQDCSLSLASVHSSVQFLPSVQQEPVQQFLAHAYDKTVKSPEPEFSSQVNFITSIAECSNMTDRGSFTMQFEGKLNG